MLALVLALASADPSVVVTAAADAPLSDGLPMRALALAEGFGGAMGVEAPFGPLYVGGGAFGRAHRSAAASVEGVALSESTSSEVGALLWLQGRFLDLEIVDVSWVTRARGGWALSTQHLADDDLSSTIMSVGAALGAIADARIVEGVAVRVGVDVVAATLSNTSFAGPTFELTGDDVSFAMFAPHAGLVIDLL